MSKPLSPWAQTAAAARRAIAAARRAGELGDLPADVKIHVTCRCYAGGSDVTMTITTDGQTWGWDGRHRQDEFPRPTAAARELGAKLAALFTVARGDGYSWGDVSLDGMANLAAVPRRGWSPNDD